MAIPMGLPLESNFTERRGLVTQEKVSVVIPVYNGEAFIDRCVESLLAQDYPDVEIIVVDDGSTDKTCELIAPPVRLMHTGGRKGAGAARNLGAAQALGCVLMFTDADCVVPTTWVSRAMETMRRHGVRCGGGGYAGPVRQLFVQQFAHDELIWRRRNFNGYVQTLVSNNMYCYADLFHSVGGFPEDYCAATCEDTEFSWKVSRRENIWWDVENGVFHDFASTVQGYLRQQMRFARDGMRMVLGQSALLKGKTHHGKQLYVEIVLTGLAVITLLPGWWRFSVAAFAATIAVNAPFLAWLSIQRSVVFTIRAAGMVLLRNVTVIWGCLVGFYGFLGRRRKQ